ncbi:hypothetical protein N2152v2_002215 [Parachlorella kessleri]
MGCRLANSPSPPAEWTDAPAVASNPDVTSAAANSLETRFATSPETESIPCRPGSPDFGPGVDVVILPVPADLEPHLLKFFPLELRGTNLPVISQPTPTAAAVQPLQHAEQQQQQQQQPQRQQQCPLTANQGLLAGGGAGTASQGAQDAAQQQPDEYCTMLGDGDDWVDVPLEAMGSLDLPAGFSLLLFPDSPGSSPRHCGGWPAGRYGAQDCGLQLLGADAGGSGGDSGGMEVHLQHASSGGLGCAVLDPTPFGSCVGSAFTAASARPGSPLCLPQREKAHQQQLGDALPAGLPAAMLTGEPASSSLHPPGTAGAEGGTYSRSGSNSLLPVVPVDELELLTDQDLAAACQSGTVAVGGEAPLEGFWEQLGDCLGQVQLDSWDLSPPLSPSQLGGTPERPSTAAGLLSQLPQLPGAGVGSAPTAASHGITAQAEVVGNQQAAGRERLLPGATYSGRPVMYKELMAVIESYQASQAAVAGPRATGSGQARQPAEARDACRRLADSRRLRQGRAGGGAEKQQSPVDASTLSGRGSVEGPGNASTSRVPSLAPTRQDTLGMLQRQPWRTARRRPQLQGAPVVLSFMLPSCQDPSLLAPTSCTFLFQKALSAVDASRKAGRIAISKRVEHHFPPLRDGHEHQLQFCDTSGWSYQLRFCHKFYSGSDGARNQACLEGAQDFLVRHRLGANSLVAFYQAEDGRYVLDCISIETHLAQLQLALPQTAQDPSSQWELHRLQQHRATPREQLLSE